MGTQDGTLSLVAKQTSKGYTAWGRQFLNPLSSSLEAITGIDNLRLGFMMELLTQQEKDNSCLTSPRAHTKEGDECEVLRPSAGSILNWLLYM